MLGNITRRVFAIRTRAVLQLVSVFGTVGACSGAEIAGIHKLLVSVSSHLSVPWWLSDELFEREVFGAE